MVEVRRLDVVPADVVRATSFLRQAEERLNQLPLLTSVVVRYGIAYDACHDTGEALLAAYGFRTTNGPGQQDRYEAKPVGAAATEKAEQVARTLFDAASPEASRRDPAARKWSARSPAETPRDRSAQRVSGTARRWPLVGAGGRCSSLARCPG